MRCGNDNAATAMTSTTQPDTDDLSLERLDASIQAALDRLIDGGRCSDTHREEAAELRRRLESLQQKLPESHKSAAAHELPPAAKSDFDLLAWDFKRWVAGIDEQFENREPRTPLFH
jgi:hypothetical protein